jgi:hypothetical protein
LDALWQHESSESDGGHDEPDPSGEGVSSPTHASVPICRGQGHTDDVVADIMDDDIVECLPGVFAGSSSKAPAKNSEPSGPPSGDMPESGGGNGHDRAIEHINDANDTSSSSSSASSDIASADLVDSDIIGEVQVEPPPHAPPALRHGWRYAQVEGGWIVYNTDPGTNLNGHCGNPAHPRCHFDKVTSASRVANRSGQGRPLGALALWLAASDDCPTREEHQLMKPWVLSHAARHERVCWRERLHDLPGCEELFEMERPKRDDSESEPDIVP